MFKLVYKLFLHISYCLNNSKWLKVTTNKYELINTLQITKWINFLKGFKK